MATTSKKVRTVPLRMKVSPVLYEYLGDLIGKTLLGASENDVATSGSRATAIHNPTAMSSERNFQPMFRVKS